jgi:hypothetical protein
MRADEPELGAMVRALRFVLPLLALCFRSVSALFSRCSGAL